MGFFDVKSKLGIHFRINLSTFGQFESYQYITYWLRGFGFKGTIKFVPRSSKWEICMTAFRLELYAWTHFILFYSYERYHNLMNKTLYSIGLCVNLIPQFSIIVVHFLFFFFIQIHKVQFSVPENYLSTRYGLNYCQKTIFYFANNLQKHALKCYRKLIQTG